MQNRINNHSIERLLLTCISAAIIAIASVLPSTSMANSISLAPSVRVCGTGATSVELRATGSSTAASWEIRWYYDAALTSLSGTGTFLGAPYPGAKTFSYNVTVSGATTFYVAIYANNVLISTTATPQDVIFETISVSASGIFDLCESGSTRLTASGAPSGQSYSWYNSNQGFIQAGVTFDTPVLTSTTVYYVDAPGYTCSKTKVTVTVRTDYNDEIAAFSVHSQLPCINAEVKLYTSNSPQNSMILWYNSLTGNALGPPVIDGKYYAYVTGPVTYYAAFRTNECQSPRKPVVISPVDPAPPANQNFTGCISREIEIAPVFSGANLKWFDFTNNVELGITPVWRPSDVVELKDYQYKVAAISSQGCISSAKATITFTPNSDCEDDLNWIESISYGYDGSQTQPITSHSKAYFDWDGKGLQVQTKTLDKAAIVITPKALQDEHGRDVLTFLSAPIQSSTFKYDHFFIRSSPTQNYNAQNFQGNKKYNPDPIGSTTSSTLAWYYSENNNIETDVPKTSFPYARKEYYEDATGDTKRVGDVGEALRLGSGHEILSGTFPVFTELAHYYATREIALPGITQIPPTADAGVQTVGRDQNGKYSITIGDKSGNIVLTARSGSANNHTLAIHNIVTSQVLDESSSNYRPSTYFYLLEDQQVSITSMGAQYIIEDIIEGATYNPGADGDPGWEAGFYRIILSTGTLVLEYTNYLADVSYSFYNDAGRLKTSVSPNGVKQLKAGIVMGSVDQTSNTYNHRGWLLSTTEPDAGTTRYQYRRDGKIRFSQNALQYENDNAVTRNAGTGKFSYTHYDYLGRPVESGEYTGAALTFASVSAQLELEFDPAADFGADKKDWIRSYYEFAANEDPFIPDLPPGLPSDIKQENLRGAVSSTQNANIQTWYSYDEFGRVTWMAQKPARINRTFVTRYTYDYLGNITVVHNASYAGTTVELDAFYHHYEYDKDNRLAKAYTSIDGATKKLRATYDYYLHGPLKRIELGDKLQGIDFVYNIHGWLTQINHPDNAQDPGRDGDAAAGNAGVRPDVFGMVLDYYESDLNNLYTASTFSPSRMKDLHGLPVANTPAYAANHQPLIRFNDFYSYDPSEANLDLKEHSAENPKYKSMLSELNNNR
jgi:hypothetical protein